MAISLSSLAQGSTPLPPRILVYGVQGIGKTTLAASAPSPVVIQTEDGLGVLDVTHFPLAKSYGDVMEALTSLATEDHNFKTLVVDSLDWMEPLVWKHTCEINKWDTIEAPGYGKGYVSALESWSDYLDAINYLRNERGMIIIQTAHSNVKRYDDPTSEPYDRYHVKMHKGAAAKLLEHSDMVLFANYRVSTTKSDSGFGSKKTRAVGTGERLLFTEERPAFIAKNRYSMPPEIPLSWDALAETIPFLNSQTGEN